MNETKKCQNCHKDFVIESEDFDFYEKMSVPAPTFCPECRTIRRFVWWNEHNLFRKKEELENKEVFSTFPEESLIKIYDHDYWWSDEWDSLGYGQEIDFSRPFFEQIKNLLYTVPLPSRGVSNLVESDYSNLANDLKNCYLCFNIDFSENCLYCVESTSLRDCLEISMGNKCELSYESLSPGNSFQVFFSSEISQCRHVWFSFNCHDCSNCFGCINLKHKKYYIFNKSYSQKEYEKKIKEFNLGSYKSLIEIKNKVKEFHLRYPRKYIHGLRNAGEITGDYIYSSKNVLNCFGLLEAENCRYSQSILRTKDAYDYTNWGANSELIYETIGSGTNNYNIKFNYNVCEGNNNVEYSLYCFSSSNLFGCVGLKSKQYCILNKQYTKEEYEEIIPKIKKHMIEMPYVDKKGRVYRYGEFFPSEFSPFGYNKTKAQEYFPLRKEEALTRGYFWQEREERNIKPDVKTEDIPDHIKEVEDDILGKTIQCAHSRLKKDGTLEQNCNEQCTTAFKIVPQELEFYRKMEIPLPRLCPSCRHHQRIKQRNPIKLWKRKCQCNGTYSENKVYKNTAEHFHGEGSCPNEFETTFSPDRKEIVYCEDCYNREMT